jgi:hypothetical protein
MTAKNDITGDLIKSRYSNEAYAVGYERIFGNKNKAENPESEAEETSEVKDEEKRRS